MKSIAFPDYMIPAAYAPPAACAPAQTAARSGSFLEIAAALAAGSRVEGTAAEPAAPAAARAASLNAPTEPDELQAERYKQYLESRFGPVTIESVGRDQESLDAAAKRMRGRDIVIAPNIFAQMVQDPDKAACFEQKISYFFTDVIPNGHAWAASVGLTFEPCGVVVHEDGRVTYICGGGDTPERVAEVARINQERDARRAAERKAYFERSAAAAAMRQAQFMRAAALQQTRFSGAANTTNTAQQQPYSEVFV